MVILVFIMAMFIRYIGILEHEKLKIWNKIVNSLFGGKKVRNPFNGRFLVCNGSQIMEVNLIIKLSWVEIKKISLAGPFFSGKTSLENFFEKNLKTLKMEKFLYQAILWALRQMNRTVASIEKNFEFWYSYRMFPSFWWTQDSNQKTHDPMFSERAIKI